ncbi:hypothetical protein [Caldimonas sp. KR1-144]|uniref:hypothetical protein n=1 Tax=Caldimonas sp. KR1-144 TaxID=3400911 RepID=UPI003C075803
MAATSSPVPARLRALPGLAWLLLPMAAAVLAYLLASLWPRQLPAATIGHELQTVRLLWSGLAFEITADVQLALFAGVFGGLGCLMPAVARLPAATRRGAGPTAVELGWHLLSPLFGIAAALLLHVVMRSSVLTDSVAAGRFHPLGLAMHGLLAGLLSKASIDRLGEQLLGRLSRPADAADGAAAPPPVVLRVEAGARGGPRVRPTLIVRGARFVPASQAYVNGRPQSTVFIDDTQLLVRLEWGELAPAEALRVRVLNPRLS